MAEKETEFTFYFSDKTDEGREAIQKLQKDPSVGRVDMTWSLGAGDKTIPMLGVIVDNVIVNVRRESQLGQQLNTLHLDRFSSIRP